MRFCKAPDFGHPKPRILDGASPGKWSNPSPAFCTKCLGCFFVKLEEKWWFGAGFGGLGAGLVCGSWRRPVEAGFFGGKTGGWKPS